MTDTFPDEHSPPILSDAVLRPKRAAPKQRKGLKELIAHLGVTSATLVEVGSYAGESASIFLSSGRFATIHCVDPWDTPGAKLAMEAFDELAAKAAGRVVKHQARSVDAAQSFDDESVDVVYLDGDHSLTAVRADIRAWMPKLRPGGWLAGHDYYWEFPGVLRGVHELVGKPERVFRDGSWVVRRRELKR